MTRALAALLGLLVAVPVAGCGGDDGGDDEEAIREVIRLSLTTNEPERDCGERLSDSFIERSYGDPEECERIQGEDDDGPDAQEIEFAGVEVDGDEASATIEVTEGKVDGVKGGIDLVREDGDWRINDLSVPLLRTIVNLGLRSGQTEGLPAGGDDCVREELQALPDAEFRELAYLMIGQRPEAQRQILELLAGCEGEGGISLLREAFETGIVESLREQNSGQAEIDCVISGIRDRVSDDRLLELVSGPNANEAAARELGPVVQACE